MTAANIVLHIEELVLSGIGFSDRTRIGEALESALSRLLEERGVPASVTHDREVMRLDGGSSGEPLKPTAEAIGTMVAKALYRGLRR